MQHLVVKFQEIQLLSTFHLPHELTFGANIISFYLVNENTGINRQRGAPAGLIGKEETSLGFWESGLDEVLFEPYLLGCGFLGIKVITMRYQQMNLHQVTKSNHKPPYSIQFVENQTWKIIWTPYPTPFRDSFMQSTRTSFHWRHQTINTCQVLALTSKALNYFAWFTSTILRCKRNIYIEQFTYRKHMSWMP